MPILILGLLVAGCLLGYIFITNHKDSFIRKKEDVHGPFNVIYLPEDLEEEKKKKAEHRSGKEESKAPED